MNFFCLLFATWLVIKSVTLCWTQTAPREVETALRISWKFYEKQVAQGIDLEERRRILEDLIYIYKGSDVNLSQVEMEKNFVNSLIFYQKQVEQGIDLDAQIISVNEILNKYRNQNVNLSHLESDRSLLNRLKSYNQQVAPGASQKERLSALEQIFAEYQDVLVEPSRLRKEVASLVKHQECKICHGVYSRLEFLSVKPNKSAINPITGRPMGRIGSLCLACHSKEGGLGILPIDPKKTHPLEVLPSQKVTAPKEALKYGYSDEEGKLTCLSCHEPHPLKNKNYKFLRFDPGPNSSKINPFCAICHPEKSKLTKK